jgi:hypothetical protein
VCPHTPKKQQLNCISFIRNTFQMYLHSYIKRKRMKKDKMQTKIKKESGNTIQLEK